MTKGKPSFGKRQKRTHIICRRCGRHAFHISKEYCAYCGFGYSAKLRQWNWRNKAFQKTRRIEYDKR